MVERWSGKRIYLGPLDTSEEAVKKYMVWMNNKEFVDFLGNAKYVRTLEDEKEWLESVQKAKDEVHFGIYLKCDDILIGSCDIKISDRSNGVLGICIGETDYQELGYGTEAMRALVDFAFTEIGLHRLELWLDADNTRAYNCYLTTGFTEVGRVHEVCWHHNQWHDGLCMELLYRDWNK